MKNYYPILFFIILIFGITTCIPEVEEKVEGMTPIYGNPDDFSQIAFLAPQAVVNRGNILTYGTYIFINEKLKGIHIYDNSNPNNPVNIGFLRIPGNNTMTIDSGFLYADNSLHLLVIDIRNLGQPIYVSHIRNHFKSTIIQDLFPPDYNGKFECAKAEKGIVLGWEQKIIINPRCFTN